MPKSSLQAPQLAAHPLEEILTRALLSYFAEAPLHPTQQVMTESARAPLQRLLLVAHPGLAADCLCGSLRENGYGVVVRSLYDSAKPDNLDADLVILSMSQCQPAALAALRQRVDEIRGASLETPIMAMIENAERDAIRELAAIGLAALVVGPLSAKIALATVHLALLGGPQVTAEIYLRSGCGGGGVAASAAIEAAPASKAVPGHGGFLALGTFTSREVALLARLREGMQNKVIAHELGIAESTVKVHLRNIMAKLHASNRTQVASMLASYETLLSPKPRVSGDLDAVPLRNLSGPVGR